MKQTLTQNTVSSASVRLEILSMVEFARFLGRQPLEVGVLLESNDLMLLQGVSATQDHIFAITSILSGETLVFYPTPTIPTPTTTTPATSTPATPTSTTATMAPSTAAIAIPTVTAPRRHRRPACRRSRVTQPSVRDVGATNK